MPFIHKSMYTDAQWKWLHDRFMDGCTIKELIEFAMCHRNTMTYHWERLGLSTSKHGGPLNREEFEALGGNDGLSN